MTLKLSDLTLLLPDYPQPDPRGRFGRFGGRYVPETLIPALDELEEAYRNAKQDPSFLNELDRLLREFVGRPSPLYLAQRLTDYAGGAKIYLKREDFNYTGAHKINNCLGQALCPFAWAKSAYRRNRGRPARGRQRNRRALFGLDCVVYMGAEDIRRQELNVFRMKLLGRRSAEVTSGTKPSRTPPTRRCAMGDQRPRHAFTSWAASWGRTPIPRWCAISRA